MISLYKKYHIAYCCIGIALIVALTGCSKILNGRYDPTLSIGEQIKTRHYDHSAIVFGKGELLDEILDASEEKDADRIYALFSDYAIEENDELYSEIEFYLDNFPEIDELFNRGCSEFGSHNIGSTEYNYLYEPVVFITDSSGNIYRLVVMWIEGDSEKPEKQGIHSIHLTDLCKWENIQDTDRVNNVRVRKKRRGRKYTLRCVIINHGYSSFDRH